MNEILNIINVRRIGRGSFNIVSKKGSKTWSDQGISKWSDPDLIQELESDQIRSGTDHGPDHNLAEHANIDRNLFLNN